MMPASVMRLRRAAGGSGADYLTTVLSIPNLVAHWRFNETTGLVAADSSGNGFDVTFSGAGTAPTWAQSVIVNGTTDGSVKCNSTTEGASVDPAVFTLATDTSEFTCVAWMEQATSNDNGPIFSARDAGNSILSFDYGFNGAANGRVVSLVLADNGSGLTSVIGAGTGMSGEVGNIFMHVLRIKSDKSMQIFENNSIIGTATHTMNTGVSPDSTNTRLFEDPRNVALGTFIQKISNVSVFDRALTDGEIATLWGIGS